MRLWSQYFMANLFACPCHLSIAWHSSQLCSHPQHLTHLIVRLVVITRLATLLPLLPFAVNNSFNTFFHVHTLMKDKLPWPLCFNIYLQAKTTMMLMIWWKYNDALFSNFEIDAMDCTKYVLLFLKEHTVTCNALLVDHGRSSAQLRTIIESSLASFSWLMLWKVDARCCTSWA